MSVNSERRDLPPYYPYYGRGQKGAGIQVAQPVERAGDPLTYASADYYADEARRVQAATATHRQLQAIRKTTERTEIVSWIALGVGLITLGLVGYWSWKVVELAHAISAVLGQ